MLTVGDFLQHRVYNYKVEKLAIIPQNVPLMLLLYPDLEHKLTETRHLCPGTQAGRVESNRGSKGVEVSKVTHQR